MSLADPSFTESVIVRSAGAEVVGRAPTTVRLLADASSAGGALSTQRVTLATSNVSPTASSHPNRCLRSRNSTTPTSSPVVPGTRPGPYAPSAGVTAAGRDRVASPAQVMIRG